MWNRCQGYSRFCNPYLQPTMRPDPTQTVFFFFAWIQSTQNCNSPRPVYTRSFFRNTRSNFNQNEYRPLAGLLASDTRPIGGPQSSAAGHRQGRNGPTKTGCVVYGLSSIQPIYFPVWCCKQNTPSGTKQTSSVFELICLLQRHNILSW
jgi:hypothetical protein